MYHEILPPCTHVQKEITFPMQVYIPVNSSGMHKNTSMCASVFIVWELKELTEYSVNCLKRALTRWILDFAQMYHEIIPPIAHMFRRMINCCIGTSLHPSVNMFYMHKRHFRKCIHLRELPELTEYCQLLKKGSVKCSGSAQMYHEILPPYTCAEGDHLFLCNFIPVNCSIWHVNLHWNRWSPSAHVLQG